ncbi:MAG TPA: class I adenylate-forming enzyme family protein [Thermoanaerobaculia bacterium]|nr:class I adenylate-forming enzyme family protein [Thermoanaerobaculia bacterium]
MFERFVSLAEAAPGSPAIIEATNGRVITRGELLARAEELAADVRPRQVIGVQLPNSAEFVALILAISRQRAVGVLIDRDASDAEMAAINAHFGIGHRTPAEMPEAARIIKLTSGSSGLPKGIVTTEANLIADCQHICASMDIRPTDINFGAIPLSHSYGFSNLVMPLIVQGTPIVISNDYLPQNIIDLCNRYSCTILPGIPMMFEALAATEVGRFKSVRTFLSAGAPLPASTSRKFRERFGVTIHSFYGCSECGGITYDRAGGAVERGTVGTAMDGVTIELRESRVIVRSDSAALGYWQDSFSPFLSGQFVTDDLAEIRDGEVALVGRASEWINAAGKKINPREIEHVILQIDGVRQVKVYGEPAGARGEVVAAAVVASPDVTREQVRNFCRERLSLHKVPRIVKLIERIPVDERGKIRRSALNEALGVRR